MKISHEVMVERVELQGGDAGYLLVRPEHPDGRNALLGHGFMSNPYHLLGLAEHLAEEGMTVGVAEYGEPLPGETYELPSDYKHRRACMVMEDVEHRFTSDEWHVAVHSYGGVVLKKLLDDAPEPIDEASFVCALGFGEPVKVLHPERILDVIKIYGSELFSAFTKGKNVFNRHALAAQIATAAHRPNRVAELEEIRELSFDYAIPAIHHAEEHGVDMSVLIAPRDHVVKPEGTSSSMQGDVKIIHAKANHFAPITHPHRVAQIILE